LFFINSHTLRRKLRKKRNWLWQGAWSKIALTGAITFLLGTTTWAVAAHSPLFQQQAEETSQTFSAGVQTPGQNVATPVAGGDGNGSRHYTDPWVTPEICEQFITNPHWDPYCEFFTDPEMTPGCGPDWTMPPMDPDCSTYPYYDAECPPTNPVYDIDCVTDPAWDPECASGYTDPDWVPDCFTDPEYWAECYFTNPEWWDECVTDPTWDDNCGQYTDPDWVPNCYTDPDYWDECYFTNPQWWNECVTDPEWDPDCGQYTDPDWVPDCFTDPDYWSECYLTNPEWWDECMTDPEWDPTCGQYTDPGWVPECYTDPDYWDECWTNPNWDPPCGQYTDPWVEPDCYTDPQFWDECWTNPDWDPPCGQYTDPWIEPDCYTDPEYWSECWTNPDWIPTCWTDPEWMPDECLTAIYLQSFEVNWENHCVVLDWQTALESDLDHFLISRRAADDAEFSQLYIQDTDENRNAPTHSYSYIDRAVLPSSDYSYRLQLINLSGEVSESRTIAIATPAAQQQNLPEGITVYRSYPNPANPVTHIEFALNGDISGNIELAIYNVAGKLVTTLASEPAHAGYYNYTWDGTDAASSGVYFAVLRVGDKITTMKLMLVK